MYLSTKYISYPSLRKTITIFLTFCTRNNYQFISGNYHRLEGITRNCEMVDLVPIQEISLSGALHHKPTITSISGTSETLLVSSGNTDVHVFQRVGIEEQFKFSGLIYNGHVDDCDVTALALQDTGVLAVSGDSKGHIHLWSTDSTSKTSSSAIEDGKQSSIKYIEHENSVRKQFAAGRVTDLAISRLYILASFYNDETSDGYMVLIRKGLNLEDKWTIEKEYFGVFSKVSLCEYGKPSDIHVMYYSEGKIVYEKAPLKETVKTFREIPNVVAPWCIRRNLATADLVFGIIIQRKLVLWNPSIPFTERAPKAYVLSSIHHLKLNQSLVMSSVIQGKMFLVSIFDNKVCVIRATRIQKPSEMLPHPENDSQCESQDNAMKDLENENASVLQDSSISISHTPATTDHISSSLRTHAPKLVPTKTVLEVLTDHVEDRKRRELEQPHSTWILPMSSEYPARRDTNEHSVGKQEQNKSRDIETSEAFDENRPAFIETDPTLSRAPGLSAEDDGLPDSVLRESYSTDNEASGVISIETNENEVSEEDNTSLVQDDENTHTANINNIYKNVISNDSLGVELPISPTSERSLRGKQQTDECSEFNNFENNQPEVEGLNGTGDYPFGTFGLENKSRSDIRPSATLYDSDEEGFWGLF